VATTVDYVLKVTSKAAQDSLKGAADSAKGLTAGLVATAGAAAVVTSSMAVLASGVIAVADAFIEGAKAIVEFAQESADLVNDINDLSNRSAIATDSIKGLQFALRASGQDAGQATQILSKFPAVLSQAQVEGSRTAEAFAALGIQLTDAQGNLRSANDIFLETTSSLQAIGNQTERATKAVDIFGRSGAQLLQALGQTQGLEQFVRLADKFGVRTGPKASDAAADFQATIAALDTALDGLKSTFIEAFGADISRLLLDFAEQIAFVQRVLVLFSDDATAAFSKVIEVLKFFFELGLTAAKSFGIGLASQIPIIGGFAQAALQLADGFDVFDKTLGFLANKTLPNFQDRLNQARKDAKEFRGIVEGLTAGGFTGANLAGAGAGGAGGAGKAGGAGAGLSKAVELIPLKINDGFRAGSITLFETLSPLEEAMIKVQNGILAAGKFIKDVGGAITSPSSFVNAIAGAAGPIGEAIGGALGTLAKLGERSPEEIKEQFTGFADSVAQGLEVLPRILIQVLPKFVISLVKGIGLAILKLPAILADAIGEAFVRIWEGIKEFFRSIFTREGRRERAKERRGNIKEFFKDLGESSEFFLSGGRMPAAQSGIRFTGAKRGLAMLHEGETVIPASGRTGQAEQRSMGSMGGSPINIVINSAVVENRAIDELVRRLESRFSTFGAGKSSLFGR
jgi:hypothetical protein